MARKKVESHKRATKGTDKIPRASPPPPPPSVTRPEKRVEVYYFRRPGTQEEVRCTDISPKYDARGRYLVPTGCRAETQNTPPVIPNLVNELVTEYGELYRRLIGDTLVWVQKYSGNWDLPKPVLTIDVVRAVVAAAHLVGNPKN